jgi:hypothetical protein
MDEKIRILECKLIGYKGNGSPIWYLELAGPSNVSKPTDYNGGYICALSVFMEDDTGDVYRFDETAATWRKWGA